MGKPTHIALEARTFAGAGRGLGEQGAWALLFFALAILCLPIPVMSYARDVGIVDWPREVSGFPAFRDFVNLWTGGHGALTGAYEDLFVKTRHTAEIERLIGVTHPALTWSYPPTAMLPLMPFALLPFPAAAALWTGLGLFVYIAALGVRLARLDTLTVLAAVALVPGVFLCVTYGQTALLTSAILYFGLKWSRERPWAAGVVLALLVCKPQIGLIVPAALIGLGAWRAFAATAIMSLVYLAATLLVAGVEPWKLFFAITLPQQSAYFAMERFDATMLFAPFFFLRELGLASDAAMAGQGVISLFVMGAMGVALRRLKDFDSQFLLIAIGALLVSPYMQAYELPVLALACGRLVLSPSAIEHLGRVGTGLVLALATVGALFSLSVFIRTGINYLSPMLLVAFLTVAAAALAPRPQGLKSRLAST